MNMSIEFARKMSLAYNMSCKSLCQELKLPQTAFDILMFLANNPNYKTASDIVEIRKIKANLVSVNVDRLVQEGYLQRQAVEVDRRKTELLCTPKAQPVIDKQTSTPQIYYFFCSLYIIQPTMTSANTIITPSAHPPSSILRVCQRVNRFSTG